MTASCFWSISSKLATQFERQNLREPAAWLRHVWFCAIVVCVSLMPFSGAAGQSNGVAVIGSEAYPCSTAGVQLAISDAVLHNGTRGTTQSVVDASNCTTLTITSEIYVGPVPPDPTAAGKRIKFIVPANGSWTTASTFNDPNKYALKWGDGAMIYGARGAARDSRLPSTPGAALICRRFVVMTLR
jgi:hypothetical protein